MPRTRAPRNFEVLSIRRRGFETSRSPSTGLARTGGGIASLIGTSPISGSNSVFINTNTPGAYQHGRLTATPSTWGSGEFCIGIWFKATNLSNTGVLSDATVNTAAQRDNWQTATLTPQSGGTFGWTHNNFLIDGFNNTGLGANVHNGTLALGFHASGRPMWLVGDGAPADARTWNLHAISSSTGTSCLDGNWHLYELNRSWTGASSALYTSRVDGQVVATETSTARTNMRTWWNSWSGFSEAGLYFFAEKLAAVNNSGQPQWSNAKGWMGPLMLWSRSVPDSEAADIYNDIVTGSESGLVSWYRFNEASGTSAANNQATGQAISFFNTGSGLWNPDGPTLESPAGTLTHGQSFSFTGSGFGTKTTAAPLLWDNCSHGQSLSTRWGYAIPLIAPNPTYGMTYRASGHRGVTPPHSNATSFLCGAHHSGGGDEGQAYNVFLGLTVPRPTGWRRYWSWYERLDPSWPTTSIDLNNHKWFGSGPQGSYNGDPYIYLDYDIPNAPNSGQTWGNKLRSGMAPDDYGTSVWRGGCNANPIAGWLKRELWISSSGAELYGVMNNSTAPWGLSGTTPVFNSIPRNKCEIYMRNGSLNGISGTGSEGPGGYNRGQNGTIGQNSWRYFADLYCDTTFARVMLANNANYDLANIVEPQPTTAWAPTGITATCNKGRLPSGTAHLFVFDADNNRQYIGPRTVA